MYYTKKYLCVKDKKFTLLFLCFYIQSRTYDYNWDIVVCICNFVLFGVVAQLIERYVRIVEVVGLSPISSTKNS